MNQAAIRHIFSGDHVSYSRLFKYKMCPRAYRYRYMDRAPPETRASTLVFGSSIHEALARFYESLMNNKPEPTVDELAKVFTDYFQVELTKGAPIIFPEKESAEILLAKGVEMLTVFHEKAERPYRVVTVESPFAVELTDDLTGVVTRFVGIFDCVVQDADGRFRILEHKTAARRWADDRLETDGQVTCYGWVAPQVGFPGADVTIQILLKQKAPGFETYTPPRTDRDRADFIETINGVLRAIDADAFWCQRDWHCRTCEFASRCVAG